MPSPGSSIGALVLGDDRNSSSLAGMASEVLPSPQDTVGNEIKIIKIIKIIAKVQ